MEISIVRVLRQEVLGIGAHISRGLVARRLSTRTCCGNGETNIYQCKLLHVCMLKRICPYEFVRAIRGRTNPALWRFH